MGTRAEVSVVCADADAARLVEQHVLDEVSRLESIFTRFAPDSALVALRRTGVTEVEELTAVVASAWVWRDRTSGAFHPGIQPLVDLWDHAEATGVPPDAPALAAAVSDLAERRTADLDLNGIAKGWIADHALRVAGDDVTSGWLSLGGDIVHRGAGSLVVGIEDPARPFDNVDPLASVELRGEALATSGGGRRWWSIAGERHPKVLDPRTGRPADGIGSATVIAPAAATADVLATAALVLGVDETFALVDEAGGACFLVLADGTTTSSSDRFRRV